jgi:hypothetical protein
MADKFIDYTMCKMAYDQISSRKRILPSSSSPQQFTGGSFVSLNPQSECIFIYDKLLFPIMQSIFFAPVPFKNSVT